MSLTPGTSLGPYEVVAEIGKGGMGEVYRARDTKLDRDVALKVLPQAFTDDPDRLARFEREAKVLASLNHPNIGGIHGLEESEGIKALVLEYIDGPTLADRIRRGPIPVDEALPIAKQIAEALEAAYEQGIIHRDLKPANVKVKDDGTVKVLDFGLAKALGTTPEGDPSQSPTLTTAATQMGVIMGTAAYMSPEQARGKPVDRRADIWSFGAVLFEMLTGKRAFEGEDVSVTLANVINQLPDWGRLPEGISPSLETYLQRCLEKDPTRRVQAIGDVRLALEGAFERPFDALASGTGGSPRLSPDERYVAVDVMDTTGSAVMVFDLQRRTMTRLTTHPADDWYPIWNGDGRAVLFSSERDGRINIYSKPSDGTGAVERVTVSDYNQWPETVSSDGRTLVLMDFAGGDADLSTLSLEGDAEPRSLITTQFDERLAHGSPDGRWIAYTSNESGRGEVYVRPFPNVDEGKWIISLDGGMSPRWAPSGRELFFRSLDSTDVMVVAVETRLAPRFPSVCSLDRIRRPRMEGQDAGMSDRTVAF